MGYDTSILNFVTLGLKFCFANSFDSCRMGGLALFTIQVFSKIFSGIFVQKGSLLKRSFILNSKEFFFFSTTSYHADFNCPSKMIKTILLPPGYPWVGQKITKYKKSKKSKYSFWQCTQNWYTNKNMKIVKSWENHQNRISKLGKSKISEKTVHFKFTIKFPLNMLIFVNFFSQSLL